MIVRYRSAAAWHTLVSFADLESKVQQIFKINEEKTMTDSRLRTGRSRPAHRVLALLACLALGLAAGVGCGGGEDQQNNQGQAGAGSNWDQMNWDQGTWS